LFRHAVGTASMTTSRCIALIPAAGFGNRMQSSIPKQYLPLGDRPMLQIVLDTFARTTSIDHTYLIVAADDPHVDQLLAAYPPARLTVLRCGGITRHQTVLNGLVTIQADVASSDWILVHDAARPGLTSTLIDRLIAAVGDDAVGGLLALPVADTLKHSSDQRVVKTLDRRALWSAQTPQMFRYTVLLRALQTASDCTDEASAVEALGLQPLLVEGSPFNFKVTRPDDAVLAACMLKGNA
jgi:2-C-methyl-D-erythritol 4-phosphate cytidylyltransferase